MCGLSQTLRSHRKWQWFFKWLIEVSAFSSAQVLPAVSVTMSSTTWGLHTKRHTHMCIYILPTTLSQSLGQFGWTPPHTHTHTPPARFFQWFLTFLTFLTLRSASHVVTFLRWGAAAAYVTHITGGMSIDPVRWFLNWKERVTEEEKERNGSLLRESTLCSVPVNDGLCVCVFECLLMLWVLHWPILASGHTGEIT